MLSIALLLAARDNTAKRIKFVRTAPSLVDSSHAVLSVLLGLAMITSSPWFLLIAWLPSLLLAAIFLPTLGSLQRDYATTLTSISITDEQAMRYHTAAGGLDFTKGSAFLMLLVGAAHAMFLGLSAYDSPQAVIILVLGSTIIGESIRTVAERTAALTD